MKFEVDFVGFISIIIIQVVKYDFFQLVLRERNLAHHERIETVADFVAQRTLNSAFKLALHEVYYDRLIAFQVVFPGERSHQRVWTIIRVD